MRFLNIVLLTLLSSCFDKQTVNAERKKRQKNIYGIEPENLDQIKEQLVIEKIVEKEIEEPRDVFEYYAVDENYAWENGVLVHENENWQPWAWSCHQWFSLPDSKRVTNKEKIIVNDESKWMYRPTNLPRAGKLTKYGHHLLFKSYQEDPVLKLEEPLKWMVPSDIGSEDLQEMVHLNSTYVRDSIYDKYFEIRSRELSSPLFKEMVQELYTKTYFEYMEQLKKDYKMFSYPLRLFLEREATKNILMKFVKDHEDFWWSWFDQDPAITLFIDGNYFRWNNVTMDPQGILMKELYEDQVFEIGATDFITEDGYITKSYLWYRLLKLEEPYLEAVHKEILESYLKSEIPARTKAKMYEYVKKGPALFNMKF